MGALECTDCGLSFRKPFHLAFHKKSNTHQQIDRIKALLSVDCIPFAEIARRVGVSREYIRTLAKKLGFERGMRRKSECKIIQTCSKDSILDLIVNSAKENNLVVEFFPNSECGLKRRSIKINGHLILIRKFVMRKVGNRLHAQCQLDKCDQSGYYIIANLDHLGNTLYIIPIEKVSPNKPISFSIIKAEHKWIEFKDAWHLLK